jgi:hypothetical protein
MKALKVTLILLSLLLLSFNFEGCRQKNVEPTPTPEAGFVQDYKNTFEIKLYTDKLVYKTDEKINIWATLEYIGDDNQIVIWHSNPFISFLISDGNKFNTGGAVDSILTSTILEKNKVYQFDYQKNGGYDAEDASSEFWKKFYSEKDLYLPEGQYTITVRGEFSIAQETVATIGTKTNLTDEIKITVQK